MELLGQLLLGFIAAGIAYFLHHSFGFRVGGWISSIPIIFVIMPLLVLAVSASNSSTELTINTLSSYVTNVVPMLPSLIMGHIGGAVFCAITSAITGQRRDEIRGWW